MIGAVDDPVFPVKDVYFDNLEMTKKPLRERVDCRELNRVVPIELCEPLPDRHEMMLIEFILQIPRHEDRMTFGRADKGAFSDVKEDQTRAQGEENNCNQ